jgi:hypothetical protein
MSQDNVSVLRTVGSRDGERRLHRRYLSQQIIVTFLGADHEPVSWSAAGFLTADRHPHSAISSAVEGFLTIRGRAGRYPICIELIRRDPMTAEAAYRFVDPSPSLLSALASAAPERSA